MRIVSIFAVPVMIAGIIIFGLLKRVKVYDCFLEGAKDGLSSAINILPPLVGLVVAISMFRASGIIDIISKALAPLLKLLFLPAEVLPLAILRPVSGSGSIAIITDIFKNCGPDSFAGRVASVMAGSTETTFYTLAVYFGAVNIKNTRHTLKSALLGDMTGIIMSVLVCRLLF
ncbi:MAG: spore maturation protein [Clostridia bacterium]|nr:spore maturation protein [Clostridia bacterium]